MINKEIMEKVIRKALAEDIGTGDITTQSTIPYENMVSGNLLAKETGVLCGMEVAQTAFALVDKDILFKAHFKDGDQIKKGYIIAEISGRAASVLTAERTALNFIQHLSGIATRTHEAAEKVKGTKAKIIDTRKTTPGLRVFEKYAVKTGGGSNHRFNLADGILIKDNHIKAAGSITAAIVAARANAPHTLKIEVEVETIVQIKEALAAKADIIMLDNMDIPAMFEAVALINGQALVEASGNMDKKDLSAVASTGVDFISIGALTHSVKALDISLDLK